MFIQSDTHSMHKFEAHISLSLMYKFYKFGIYIPL